MLNNQGICVDKNLRGKLVAARGASYKNCLVALAISTILSGCASQLDELNHLGSPPPVSKLTNPMEKPGYEPVHWKEEEEEGKKYSNSLWQPGASSFFKDQKARKVGDILTVTVKINDQAEFKNQTTRQRNNTDTASASSLLGMGGKIFGILPGGRVDPSSLLNVNGANTSNGIGDSKRNETVETNVAAMVTQILPNGNLVVHGDQEIRVNFELRQVSVDGLVRPEDISSSNTVDSNQIAEVKISYGGKGDITRAQQPRIGGQIIDILSPF
jgi:flagellar L-ring protein precursor FlgH